MRVIFTFLSFIVLSINLKAQAPQLVKNINPTVVDVNSHSDPAKGNYANYPDTGVFANGKFIFPARNFNGIEMWQTDGTTAGTNIIKDINSFYNFQDANPIFLTKLNGSIYFFTADWDYSNSRLFNYRLRSMDTATGTISGQSLTNNPFDYVSNVVVSNGYIYFIGYNSNNTNNAYYTTDTCIIQYDPSGYDSYTIIAHGNPHELKLFGTNNLVFDANDGTNGRELWTYDIANLSAYMVLDINNTAPGASSNPHDFVNYNNQLYFTADDGAGAGMHLCYWDMVNNFLSGVTFQVNNPNPHNKIVFNNQLYFRVVDSVNNNYNIYYYDANSQTINYLANDYSSGNGAMAIANNFLFYSANDGNTGNELWFSDGTNGYLTTDISPGDANPINLTPLNNKLLFVADDGNGPQVWVTDGNVNISTQMVDPIQQNYNQDPPKIFGVDNNGFAYFYADDGTHGKELWKTDGTLPNTSLLKDINLGDYSSIGSNIQGLDIYKGAMYFGAYDGTSSNLYKADSLGNTVTLVATGGSSGSFSSTYYSPDHIKKAGNYLFFDAFDQANVAGYELWRTDGTQAGTMLVKDINPGTGWSNPSQMTECNSLLFFLADDGTNGQQLWRSDGTTAGTLMLTNLKPVNTANFSSMTVVGNKLFFVANDSTNSIGSELWVSDGTIVGTHLVKDISPGNASSFPGNLRAIGNVLYFSANDQVHGNEPWTSDGTPTGTILLKDINPGSGSSNPSDFTKLGSYIYMAADSLGVNNTLWRTDGTAAGTHLFTTAVTFPFNLVSIGNKIIMMCDPPTATLGFEWWATDGTIAGTTQLTNFGPEGVGWAFFNSVTPFKGHAFNYVDDGVHGMELWQTDGTKAGTFINDLAPGRMSSYPYIGKGIDPYIFLADDGSSIGYEPWKINVSASVSWLNFTAKIQDTIHALLNWQTANETNNKGFIIQHSINNVTYDSIGFVPAGSPNGATYSFLDSFPKPFANYYRLKQIDGSGNVEYSNVENIFIIKPLYGGFLKSNDTLCTGTQPTDIIDSIPTTGGNISNCYYNALALGNDPKFCYTYVWQDSTVNGKWINAVPPGNGPTYFFYAGALNTTTYFRRKVFDQDNDSAVSNIITKYYKHAGDTSVVPRNAWNVYVYGGIDVTLSSPANSPYYGYYSDTAKNYNTAIDWSADSMPSKAVNYQGCPVPAGSYFTISLKRKGFSPGNYVLNILNYNYAVGVYVNNVQVFYQTIYTSITSPGTGISLGKLDSNAVVEIRMARYYYPSNLNFNFIQSGLQPGTIATNQTICTGHAPGLLNSTQYAFGGPVPANIAYQWQDSTKGNTWQNIAGANGLFYNPAAISDTTYFRRAATDGVSTPVVSDTVTINALFVTQTPELFQAGRVLSINGIVGASGYKWFLNGTQISGVTGLTYTATLAGTYTTKYTMTCGDGPASNAIVFASNALTETINFLPQPTLTFAPYETVILNATDNAGLPVQFTLLSGPAIISNDTAFITGTGTVTIQASQLGNVIYTPALPVQQSFNVIQANQTITFTPVSSKTYGDVPFGLQSVSTSGLPTTYSVVSGPATLGGSILTINGVGTIVVKASQSGNGNYAPAPDVLQSFCVGVNNVGVLTGDTSLCPVSAVYAVNLIGGANYQWGITGGGILTPNGDSATVNWQIPGNYTVFVTANSSCDTVRSIPANLNVLINNTTAPISVYNMIPADGTANLALPLTLSWIPGSATKSYDLYIWNADSTQPSTPFASGLTSVSYTLSNKGLAYHQSYKWRIVSRSICGLTYGPIQTFSLIPLPDLVLTQVLAPATAFSGQQISISWTVKNAGPGRTNVNQKWTDAVLLSTDSTPDLTVPPYVGAGVWSQLSFPIKPLLIGSAPNVAALDSGQSYTNTLNFTLPLNYSWPLYVYVITNYSPGPNAPFEVSLANDTAHALAPIQVTLSPAPDLRVDSVLTPASTFSGSAINVLFKVRNYGATTPPNTNWIDNIYISKSPFFDISTATLLTQPKANGTFFYNAPDASFTNTIQLQKDSSYDKLVSVIIPNDIYGTFYIYVYTDAGNTIYEGTLENNNTAGNLIQVFLTPTPTLTVSSITTSASVASTTQPVTVNWNLLNQGYYDRIEQNQGHYLETLLHCATCYVPYCPPAPPPPPCYYNGTCNYSYSCPKPASGYTVKDSLGYGSSYWNDYVYLSRDSTILNQKSAIYLGAYPHGAADRGVNYDNYTSLPPYTSGLGIADGVNAAIYNVNTATAISPGSVFPGTYYFSIPDTLSQGNYYVYVWANADSSVYEYPSQFQTRRSNVIIVSRPDLIVPLVTVPPTGLAGQPININYTILNTGSGGVFNHTRRDYVYASSSPVFDVNAQLIASPYYQENVPVNVPVSHQISYTLPISASGQLYFYVVTNADSSFKETNQVNNLSTITAQITVTALPPADLYVSSIALPDTVFSVFGIPFKYTVPNKGAGATFSSWTDSIFISCSSTWNPSLAIGIGARLHKDVVAGGGNYSDSFNLIIPYTYAINYSNACFPLSNNSTAYFYVKTNADNGAYEGTNTANNLFGTTSKLVINPWPDHVVTSATGDTNTLIGRNYSATWTVKNIGYNPGYQYYSSWADGLYFSKDSVFNSNAIFAGANNYGQTYPLNTNQSYTTSYANFIVPNIAAGNYYAFMFSNYNHWFSETNYNNNVNLIRNANGSAQLIHVAVPLLPDLTDSIISAPTISAIGQPITIIYKVTNNGPGATYPATWSDQFYLSTNYVPGGAGSTNLGGYNHTGVLQPGQSYLDTITLPVNLGVPPSDYVFISQTNAGANVFETNTTNDLGFTYITIFSPAPCDLTVKNIIHPDTVYLGYPDTTTWSNTNIAPNLANGIETDGIYLSKSDFLDSTAILLSTQKNTLNLLPLSMDTLSATPLLSGVTEGSYNVLVKTDLLNNIVETEKNNNVGIAAKPIYVKVKQLPMNQATAASLANNNVYFKLVIPDSLLGSTIYFTLVSNDSLKVTNQVFIGGGYLPSAANFDYEYNNPNTGNQQILMTSVINSVYYITITCVSPNPPPVQNIVLLAKKLPFAILNVNANQGGNTGNVTVNISGSLFANNMKATLYSAALKNTINASAVYFANSTSVYATFNLAGVTLGTYDVNLIKTDSTIATLAQSFTVVNANNGGLITGGGVNQIQSGSGNQPGCDPGTNSGLNAQLQTQIAIPSVVLAGYPFQFVINFSNPTNVDIPVQTRILYSQNRVPMALTQAGLSAGVTSMYLQFSEQNGPPNIIRAGGTGSITIYAQPPANYPAHTKANFIIK